MTLQLDSVELVTDMTFNIIGGGSGWKTQANGECYNYGTRH